MDKGQAELLLSRLAAVTEQSHKLQLELLETWKALLGQRHEAGEAAVASPCVLADSLPSNKPTYTVAEAAEAVGISRNAAYEAVRRGQIPSLRVGGRILIPRERLLQVLRAG
jgi:excisionase family DNA binding protein